MTTRCSCIIRNAMIYDGSGNAAFEGDVAISGDRIIAVGDASACSSDNEIDARFRALAPGFIDTHTHDDRAVLADPVMACKVSQGVTTVIGGNCGLSIAPYTRPGRPPAPLDLIGDDGKEFFASFADYFAALEIAQPAVNVVAQVGHSVLRLNHMDDLTRHANDAEIEAMAQSLRQAMKEGAAGLSTGLEYGLANAANSEEIVRLAEVVHEFGGFHTTHMRDEGAHSIDSIEEAARIGRYARIPVIISHHKLVGKANHGRSVETLQKIEELARTQALALDAYPYAASSTILSAQRVAQAAETRISWSIPHPEMAGENLSDICTEWGLSPEKAIAVLSPAGAVYFSMNEEDVSRILQFTRSMIGSDGLPHDSHPHPRLWGTFARVLGHYALDKALFPLQEAIRKMTSLPAATFGIADRGRIVEGFYADLVMFNPDRIIDKASYDNPCQPAAGIDAVWVNGVLTWRMGGPSAMLAGRGLRRQDLLPLRQEPWSMVYEDEALPFSLST